MGRRWLTPNSWDFLLQAASLHKFYVDEIYHVFIVTPLLMFTRLILAGLVDSGIVNNSLSHAGIQVVGWLLQHMPPLPPNDPA